MYTCHTHTTYIHTYIDTFLPWLTHSVTPSFLRSFMTACIFAHIHTWLHEVPFSMSYPSHRAPACPRYPFPLKNSPDTRKSRSESSVPVVHRPLTAMP